jgi:hypothetical protein
MIAKFASFVPCCAPRGRNCPATAKPRLRAHQRSRRHLDPNPARNANAVRKRNLLAPLPPRGFTSRSPLPRLHGALIVATHSCANVAPRLLYDPKLRPSRGLTADSRRRLVSNTTGRP